MLGMAWGKGKLSLGRGLSAAEILAAMDFHALRCATTYPDSPKLDRFDRCFQMSSRLAEQIRGNGRRGND